MARPYKPRLHGLHQFTQINPLNPNVQNVDENTSTTGRNKIIVSLLIGECCLCLNSQSTLSLDDQFCSVCADFLVWGLIRGFDTNTDCIKTWFPIHQNSSNDNQFCSETDYTFLDCFSCRFKHFLHFNVSSLIFDAYAEKLYEKSTKNSYFLTYFKHSTPYKTWEDFSINDRDFADVRFSYECAVKFILQFGDFEKIKFEKSLRNALNTAESFLTNLFKIFPEFKELTDNDKKAIVNFGRTFLVSMTNQEFSRRCKRIIEENLEFINDLNLINIVRNFFKRAQLFWTICASDLFSDQAGQTFLIMAFICSPFIAHFNNRESIVKIENYFFTFLKELIDFKLDREGDQRKTIFEDLMKKMSVIREANIAQLLDTLFGFDL